MSLINALEILRQLKNNANVAPEEFFRHLEADFGRQQELQSMRSEQLAPHFIPEFDEEDKDAPDIFSPISMAESIGEDAQERISQQLPEDLGDYDEEMLQKLKGIIVTLEKMGLVYQEKIDKIPHHKDTHMDDDYDEYVADDPHNQAKLTSLWGDLSINQDKVRQVKLFQQAVENKYTDLKSHLVIMLQEHCREYVVGVWANIDGLFKKNDEAQKIWQLYDKERDGRYAVMLSEMEDKNTPLYRYLEKNSQLKRMMQKLKAVGKIAETLSSNIAVDEQLRNCYQVFSQHEKTLEAHPDSYTTRLLDFFKAAWAQLKFKISSAEAPVENPSSIWHKKDKTFVAELKTPLQKHAPRKGRGST